MLSTKKILSFFVAIFFLSSILFAQRPKLLEFGWDYPDVAQLDANLDKWQHTPFDGICFSLQRNIMLAFDTVLLPASYFQYSKLGILPWGKYTDNFIILRGYGSSGPHWFDDKMWTLFAQNLAALSEAVTASKARGIFFDPEYYNESKKDNPWTFSAAQYPGKTLAQVQAMVKKRGITFIRSLQSAKQDLSFLSAWIAGLVIPEIKVMPLKDSRHVLLVSFFEGILEGKSDSASIIDGNENAYWYDRPSQFFNAATFLRNNTAKLMKGKKSIKELANMKVAQSVYYDGLMATIPQFERGLTRPQKWAWLKKNVDLAVASTDEYVWFYTEQFNWWQPHPNDTLVTLLQDAAAGYNNFSARNVTSDFTASSNSISGNLKTAVARTASDFTLQWDTTGKNLKIEFIGELPASVHIYMNGVAVACKDKLTAPTQNFKLKNFKKGKIVVVSMYTDDTEAMATLRIQ